MAQARHPNGGPHHQQPAGAVRRRAKHLRARPQKELQLQKRGHSGAGPHHHPQDQLPQHAANFANRQRHRGRPAHRQDRDDDGIPLVKPVSCGRDGPEPIVINLPTLPEQAAKIAELLQGAHADGFAWGDMAVLCRDAKARDLCARTLAKRGVPVQNRLGPGDYDPLANSVKVMTMKVSKGLEFPVVAIPGVERLERMGAEATESGEGAQALSEAEVLARREAARVLYVAATRATQRLVLGTDQRS